MTTSNKIKIEAVNPLFKNSKEVYRSITRKEEVINNKGGDCSVKFNCRAAGKITVTCNKKHKDNFVNFFSRYAGTKVEVKLDKPPMPIRHRGAKNIYW